jgi:hypothetical protein
MTAAPMNPRINKLTAAALPSQGSFLPKMLVDATHMTKGTTAHVTATTRIRDLPHIV